MLGKMMEFFEVAGIPCVFHLVTGFYCPGCGGTRAVKALLRGEIRTSIRYNPMVAYGAGVLVLIVISWGFSRLMGKPGLFIKKYGIFLAGGLVIGLINCMYKNYYLIVKGIDLLQP